MKKYGKTRISFCLRKKALAFTGREVNHFLREGLWASVQKTENSRKIYGKSLKITQPEKRISAEKEAIIYLKAALERLWNSGLPCFRNSIFRRH